MVGCYLKLAVAFVAALAFNVENAFFENFSRFNDFFPGRQRLKAGL